MQRTCKFCVIFLLFAIAAKAQKPCEIIASADKGCVPLPVQFTFKSTNTSPPVSYLWHFGDGDSSTQSNPNHAFTNPGSYITTITVIFQNGTICSDTFSKPIVVYHNPNANFIVNNNKAILLCARGNSICFADKSVPGKENAPIISWLWNFGDGQTSSKQNPCYAYSDSGYYQVTLQVTDSNGCVNSFQKVISVRYTSDVGLSLIPTFKVAVNFDCIKDVENVNFTNTTDTAGQYITKFTWVFGDGAKDTCNLQDPACLAHWTNFIHTYAKTGNYHPILFVENKYGCVGEDSVSTPIVVQPYILNPGVYPNYRTCFIQDSGATDTVAYHPLALGYYWDYGDPYRRSTGVSHGDYHTYAVPGIYTVHIDVVIGGCHYDSTLCNAVKLLGPIALIMPQKGNKIPWDTVPPNGSYLIPPATYGTYFDTSCLGKPSQKYYTYAPSLVKNGEPIYDSCKVDTIKTYNPDSLYGCNGKKVPDITYVYKKHIDSYVDTIEQIATLHYWYKGNPFPPGDVYSAPPFVNRLLYMDDTSLFSLRCHAPQKISFTNFSDKYRGYYAVDNFPFAYPSKCVNKSYPYASDSLTYNWDFHEGTAATSTTKNPVTTDRYSTEKLPTHLFRKDGCYWVVLAVSDTSTNCTDQDSLPVVLQAADAGWAPEYSNIKNMTTLIQDSLPSKGPRRGMIIKGKPCLDSLQNIDLDETLPSCFKREVSMVLDSAHDTITCPGHLNWHWINFKNVVSNDYQTFQYNQDTGWKTVGLVIANNDNCIDTVWYHDYVYIHGINPTIKVSASHICLGDTLKIRPNVPQQLGIKSFTYYFSETLDYGDTIAKPKPDTIRYRIVKQKDGSYDTITSTVHNRLWGIDDSSNLNFNYLTDTTKIVPPHPGHFLITSVILSRFGCVDTSRTEMTVGDYVDFGSDNTVVCTNDTVHFQGIVQYFLPFFSSPYGYDTANYWRSPDSARNGRKPKIPEKMEWDFNGDGIIDAIGENPYYVYTKGGSYTVTLYETDSNGCKQTLSRPGYIKVIGDSAYFTIASPGAIRYCKGHNFFQFNDSSHIIKPFKDSLNIYKIYSWTWDFGDGSPALTTTDSTKKNASYIYLTTGDFIVKLIVRTAPGTGATTKGCADSFQTVVHILGPTAKFEIKGSNKGCAPFTVLMRDLSIQAKTREWLLGDGTTTNSYGDSIVPLVYKKPGLWCPQLFVTDIVTDSTGGKRYCSDTFNYSCKIKVLVYDTNKQVLSASDTLICLGKDSVLFKSAPDTGYSTWTLHFGNGDSVTNTSPQFSYLYTKAGKYHVFIDGSGAHCPDTASINVKVIDIKSLFAVDTAKSDTPVFSFKNLSQGGVRYSWDFGDGSPVLNTSSNQEISHEFQKSGKSTICLTAYNEKGCLAKYCDTIHIDTFLYIPNVFTPNADTYNPDFDIQIKGNLAYHLDIYNRWGQPVFHSDDKHVKWDGANVNATSQNLNSQYPMTPYPAGTYYYVFHYRFIGGKNEETDGAVTLIR